jgi:hypothetical protein
MELQQASITLACPPRHNISSSPLLDKHNLGFNHKTLAPMSPSDETLTLVFKMLQKVKETLTTPRKKR